jgi:hypothetical protein
MDGKYLSLFRPEDLDPQLTVICPPILLKVKDEEGVERFINLDPHGMSCSEHEQMVLIPRKEYLELLLNKSKKEEI